jgi:hypothetical protein
MFDTICDINYVLTSRTSLFKCVVLFGENYVSRFCIAQIFLRNEDVNSMDIFKEYCRKQLSNSIEC